MDDATSAILGEFAARIDYAGLPATVRREARRIFVNFVGCALGGSNHEAVELAVAAIREFAGAPQASLLGRSERVDVVHATLVNCMSSAVHTFDDTHLSTISHPGGPVVASALAITERQPVKGAELLGAVALGVEAACRLGAMLAVPPARYNIGLFMTGITGTIGAALAAGKLMGLDRAQLQFAIGIAATQSAGLREMHGTMSSSFVCGNAARAGIVAAILAKHGFTSGTQSIEGPKGLGQLFANPPNPRAVSTGLGETYELLSITYKPYPCGIAVHPAIDAVLEILAKGHVDYEQIVRCEVTLNPVGVALTGRPHPASGLEAQVSVPHWVAATVIQGAAGLAQATDECVRDPIVAALREKVRLVADEKVAATAARTRVTLADGTALEAAVEHCRGSLERPLTDDEMSDKFIGQAEPILGSAAARRALEMCWSIEGSADAGAITRSCTR